jgi:hypothetical protein
MEVDVIVERMSSREFFFVLDGRDASIFWMLT